MEAHATVEMDHTHFDDLKSQLMGNKDEGKSKAALHSPKEEKPKSEPSSKKATFYKGDQSFVIDEDAEIEFPADKKNIRLTLRELKDRAAGDIAVKNRMHALAEEKKRVAASFKEFATLAKTDPLAALEYISNKAKEADGEFEYQKYIEKLAEQAESLGRMDDKDRKAWELEKKLSKAEKDLSVNERKTNAVLRKQEILSEYPQIGDQQFADMVEAVLSTDELLEGVENEKDVLDVVEELIQETLTQRDLISVIDEVNPAFSRDNELIFALSDQIRQNPDLTEQDVREIVSEILPSEKKKQPVRDTEREKASKTLSQKQREGLSVEHLKAQGATDFDLLKAQILEKQDELKKTPIYKR